MRFSIWQDDTESPKSEKNPRDNLIGSHNILIMSHFGIEMGLIDAGINICSKHLKYGQNMIGIQNFQQIFKGRKELKYLTPFFR